MGAVMSAMARHGGSGPVCQQAVYLLDNLSESAANMLFDQSFDGTAVLTMGVKRYGNALLSRLSGRG